MTNMLNFGDDLIKLMIIFMTIVIKELKLKGLSPVQYRTQSYTQLNCLKFQVQFMENISYHFMDYYQKEKLG